MKLGPFFSIKKANMILQWEALRRYYPASYRFAFADLLLGLASLFFNAYRVCRKSGSIYGETPLRSLHRIVEFCSLTSADCYLELGSGRGKGCFWIANFVQCKTIGLERASLFVCVSQAIAFLTKTPIDFIKADMFQADFSKPTCVYLYSTCMNETDLARLVEKMRALPEGAKVVSVSAQLPDSAHLKLAGTFPLSFPWGETQGYIHIKKEAIHDS